jgi:hypothetical protein
MYVYICLHIYIYTYIYIRIDYDTQRTAKPPARTHLSVLDRRRHLVVAVERPHQRLDAACPHNLLPIPRMRDARVPDSRSRLDNGPVEPRVLVLRVFVLVAVHNQRSERPDAPVFVDGVPRRRVVVANVCQRGCGVRLRLRVAHDNGGYQRLHVALRHVVLVVVVQQRRAHRGGTTLLGRRSSSLYARAQGSESRHAAEGRRVGLAHARALGGLRCQDLVQPRDRNLLTTSRKSMH